jgi:hypothetical protein
MGFTMIEGLIDSVICLPFSDLFLLSKKLDNTQPGQAGIEY